MTVPALAFLCVRLLSLWLIVCSFVNLAGFAADWPAEPMGSLLRVGMLSLTILPFTSALVLWAFSDALAKYLVRDAPSGPAVTSIEPGLLHTVGVSLLGLWLVVNVLPELVQVSSIYLAMRFARPPELPYDEATEYKVWTYAQASSARFASLLVRFVVGGTLFLGPKRVAQATLGGIRRFLGPARPEPAGE
jgi:hypothetical protein